MLPGAAVAWHVWQRIRYTRVPSMGGIPPMDWARAADVLVSWGYLRPDQLDEDLHDLLGICASEQYRLEREDEDERKREREQGRQHHGRR